MASSLTVDIFVSVDGWAGSEGLPGYFGYFGPELEKWITTEIAAPQLLVIGRRTYEVLAGLPDEARDESSNRMAQLEKVVFSRTLQQAIWPNTRICSEDLVEEIRRMKTESDVQSIGLDLGQSASRPENTTEFHDHEPPGRRSGRERTDGLAIVGLHHRFVDKLRLQVRDGSSDSSMPDDSQNLSP